MTMQDYFDRLEERFDEEVAIAEEARGMGFDPTEDIEIQFAEDMAERCEELLGIPGLTERIRELEENEVGREEAALQLAEEFASGDLGEFESREEKADAAVRTAIALLTEGVVAAPIEGIDSVTLNSDGGGGEYLEVHYAGPIRSAGGTGQALSVLVADYVRQLMDIDEFEASEEETERTVAGVKMYDSDVGLQYMPSEDDIRTIISNLSIRLNGDSADTREVSAYRDVVHTNSARGGMCLTIGEGIAQKAAKLQRYTVPLDLDGWDWLSDLDLGVDDPGGDDEDEDSEDEEGASDEDTVGELGGDEIPGLLQPELAEKSKKYMKDTIAGRPIIAYPSRPGGYRLRYGRSRAAGLAASGVHPASMIILNEFLAPGTQVKTERPGKAQAVTPVDSVEGPTVRLDTGEVLRIDDEDEARELTESDSVEEILDLGEMAVPYGEFLENNAPLVPASYVHEWWVQEAEDAGLSPIAAEKLNVAQSFAMAEKHGIPLHPKFTFLWHDLDEDGYDVFSKLVSDGERTEDDDESLILDDEAVPYAETLLLPHTQTEDSVVIEEPYATVVERCTDEEAQGENTMEKVNDAAGVTVRHRAPTRIGGRMGRPEKSKRREKPKFHGLIPIGSEGGNQRLIDKAARQSLNRNEAIDEEEEEKKKQERRGNGPSEDDLEAGYILENISYRENPRTGEPTWRLHDPETGERTIQRRWCSNCQADGEGAETCPRCGNDTKLYSKRAFDINRAYHDALDKLGEREANIGKVKGVKGLESESKIVEPFEKALLRAKYDILAFSDGTARYDLTDLPLTSFKPDEVGTTVETLRDLGYETALDGSELTDGDQLVELKVQDIVIHEDAGDYMLRTANYVDDLLEKHYGMEPYYDADEKEDLVGSLMLGLAPHTSAGVLCRLVGFTEASAGYAHPFFHAAKRRNCFVGETEIEHADCSGGWGGTSTPIKQLFEETLNSAMDGNTGDVDGVRVLDDETVVVELEDADIDTPFTDEDGFAHTRVGNPDWSDTQHAYTEWEKITAFSRHPAPDHLLEFYMDGGQSVSVTPDHTMVRVGTDSEPFEEVPASNLMAGDEVFIRENPDNPGGGKFKPARVSLKRHIDCEDEYVYCLTVDNQHQTVADNILTGQCDGDEDSIMMLLDGLINYSEQYLDHGRTGWSMDKPIVATTVLDPTEIDDEAHNVDVVDQYPRELYEASMHQLGPKEVDIDVAENHIRDDFTGFKHTIESSSIHAGPNQSSYVTSGDMDEKLNSQFDLAKRTRAVDERNLAEKVIDKHFLPDIRGNLRSFAQQDVRCHRCGITYRRIPLDGVCRKCSKSLLLTIYEGSVDKYVGKSLRMAEEYDIDPYLRQSIEILDDEIQSLFNDDTEHQTGLTDFM